MGHRAEGSRYWLGRERGKAREREREKDREIEKEEERKREREKERKRKREEEKKREREREKEIERESADQRRVEVDNPSSTSPQPSCLFIKFRVQVPITT